MSQSGRDIGYQLSRTYRVSRDVLFRALTDARVLREIWGVQQISVDARTGGKADAKYIAADTDWSFTLTYTDVVPDQRLETILFAPAPDGTELTVRMENFETASERDANQAAWKNALTTLATVLDRGVAQAPRSEPTNCASLLRATSLGKRTCLI